MTVGQLIEELTQFGLRYGLNKPVVMSVDTEGNSYSTLEHNDCLSEVEDENGKIVGACIWPWNEGFDDYVEACTGNK